MNEFATQPQSPALEPARSEPQPKAAATRPNGRVGVTKPAAPAPQAKAQPAAAVVATRKPFAMKYDGMPAARYAAERFSRGAR
jgi:hypothetical protein